MTSSRPQFRWAIWALLGVVATIPAVSAAQEAPIFDRFAGVQAAPKAWQILPEFPVYLRPQLEPDAKVVQNIGVNFGVSFRPRNRVYFTRSYNFAQMTWEPKEGKVERVQLTTFDISQLLNISVKRVAIVSFGLGLGVMDGIIRFRNGDFKTRLEPYVPIHFGVGFYPFSQWIIMTRLSHAFFLGPGPVVSVTRGLLGVGYNF